MLLPICQARTKSKNETRDGAIASAKLKHINLNEDCFFQDARDVSTKFSKTFNTYFFPVGEDIKRIVSDWFNYLKTQKFYGNDDPLFPMNEIGLNVNNQFAAIGIKPVHWSTTAPIREIFRKAFTVAGLQYFNPHSFRNTLVQLGQIRCKNPEEFKAWSQNLGHESVLTTLYSYGQVSPKRQADLIKQSCKSQNDVTFNNIDDIANILAAKLLEKGWR
jgi:integrase/recombinase XerD